MNKTFKSEALVERLVREFLLAWNAADHRAVAGKFAASGLRVGAMGDIAHGRAEIENAFNKLFNGPFKGAKASCDFSIRFIAENIALVEGPLKITPADGSEVIQGYALDIWKKANHTWEIIEAHPKFYPPKR